MAFILTFLFPHIYNNFSLYDRVTIWDFTLSKFVLVKCFWQCNMLKYCVTELMNDFGKWQFPVCMACHIFSNLMRYQVVLIKRIIIYINCIFGIWFLKYTQAEKHDIKNDNKQIVQNIQQEEINIIVAKFFYIHEWRAARVHANRTLW